MALRVGVDATGWTNRRGYGRFARGLLGALARIDADNRYTFFVDRADVCDSLPAGVEPCVVPVRVPAALAASADGYRSLADLYRMSRALADRRLDVLFFPSLHTYVPVVSRARKIVAIHDVIPESFPDLALGGRRARLFWTCKGAAARRQADTIVAVSEHARREILRRWQVDPRRVAVIGEAADPIFRPMDAPRPSERLGSLAWNGNDRGIVFVGGFSPHKNVDRLIDAFAAVAASRPDLRLLLVGELESETFTSCLGALRAQVERSPARDRIVFTGYLSDGDLAVLLNLATVLVLPSMMEGFGLPAVEAAACGGPVIATTRSPLPELLGKGGLYVHPHDRTDLERALTRVLDSADQRARMRAAAIEAASRLTWESAARSMLEVIEGRDEELSGAHSSSTRATATPKTRGRTEV